MSYKALLYLLIGTCVFSFAGNSTTQSFPKAFSRDGFGALDGKPFREERLLPLSVRAHQDLDRLISKLEAEPENLETLLSGAELLAWNRHFVEAIPYYVRFTKRGGVLKDSSVLQYIEGLSRLGQFAEADRILIELEKRLPGFVITKDAREAYLYHYFAYLSVVKKDLIPAASALRALHENFIIYSFPAPSDDAFDLFVNLCKSNLAAELIREELPQIEFIWPFLPPDSAIILEREMKAKGIPVPQTLMDATDLFNNGKSAPPAAWMVRSRFAIQKDQYELATKLIEKGVCAGRLLEDKRPLLYASSFQIGVAESREDFPTAYQAAQSALQAADKTGEAGALCHTYHRAGLVYEKLGDLSRAAELYQKSHALAEAYEESLMEDRSSYSISYIKTLVGLGSDLEPMIRKRWETSRVENPLKWKFILALCISQQGHHQQAAEILRSIAPTNNPQIDIRLSEWLGRILLASGDLEGASKAFDESEKLTERLENSEQSWLWKWGKARVAQARNDTTGAMKWLNLSLAAIEAQRASLQDHRLRATLLDHKYDVFEFGVDLLLKDGNTSSAFDMSERARARAFLDGIGSQHGGAPIALTRSLSDLQAVTRAAVIINFFQMRTKTIVWIIDDAKTECLQLPIGKDEMLGALHELHEGLKTPATSNRIRKSRVQTALWNPILERLPKGKELCIVPHGLIHYVPFQALCEGEGYVIQHRDIFYAPSISAWLELRSRSKPAKAEFALFDAIRSNDPASPFHQTETDAIRKLNATGRFFLGPEAVRHAFVQELPKAGILHIASHGYYDPLFPMRSGLQLVGSETDDGLIRADEIYAMRVDELGLIVMSACTSSVGSFGGGDEVTGMTRAFQTAGAHNVIGSLWPVDNATTTEIMTQFYRELNRAGNPTHALCEAQRESLKTHPIPILWAAFQLNGFGRLYTKTNPVP